jgi:hypothetical protein
VFDKLLAEENDSLLRLNKDALCDQLVALAESDDCRPKTARMIKELVGSRGINVTLAQPSSNTTKKVEKVKPVKVKKQSPTIAIGNVESMEIDQTTELETLKRKRNDFGDHELVDAEDMTIDFGKNKKTKLKFIKKKPVMVVTDLVEEEPKPAKAAKTASKVEVKEKKVQLEAKPVVTAQSVENGNVKPKKKKTKQDAANKKRVTLDMGKNETKCTFLLIDIITHH